MGCFLVQDVRCFSPDGYRLCYLLCNKFWVLGTGNPSHARRTRRKIPQRRVPYLEFLVYHPPALERMVFPQMAVLCPRASLTDLGPKTAASLDRGRGSSPPSI